MINIEDSRRIKSCYIFLNISPAVQTGALFLKKQEDVSLLFTGQATKTACSVQIRTGCCSKYFVIWRSFSVDVHYSTAAILHKDGTEADFLTLSSVYSSSQRIWQRGQCARPGFLHDHHLTLSHKVLKYELVVSQTNSKVI